MQMEQRCRRQVKDSFLVLKRDFICFFSFISSHFVRTFFFFFSSSSSSSSFVYMYVCICGCVSLCINTIKALNLQRKERRIVCIQGSRNIFV